MKKPALLIAALALTGASLTACGGGDDAESAPRSADKATFCKEIANLGESDRDLDASDTAGQLKMVHEFADTMIDLGTPKDMPEDARKEWVKILDTLANVDESDVKNDDNPMADLTSGKFSEYLAENCSSEAPKVATPESAGTDDAPEAPEAPETPELPTDVPTSTEELEDMMSDLPTSDEELEDLMSDLESNADELEEMLSDLPTEDLEKHLDDAMSGLE